MFISPCIDQLHHCNVFHPYQVPLLTLNCHWGKDPIVFNVHICQDIYLCYQLHLDQNKCLTYLPQQNPFLDIARVFLINLCTCLMF